MQDRKTTAVGIERLNARINLDLYPIHELDSRAGQALIDEAHEMMASDTLCLFEHFLRPAAVAAIATEIAKLEHMAHRVDYLSTAYGWMNNAGFPSEHPRSQLPRRNCSVISTDQLDTAGSCWELYQFDELTEFVRRMLGYETLYRTACPVLSMQINIMDRGDRFGWHFDTNDGVVSFTIQNADRGGGFEYAPLIRAEDDENYPAVARILSGTDEPRKPDLTPGTLSLFMGRRSLHRVAPVGPTSRKRMSLLFSYDRNPGVVFPEQTCQRLTRGSPEPYLGSLTPVA